MVPVSETTFRSPWNMENMSGRARTKRFSVYMLTRMHVFIDIKIGF